MFSTRTSAAGLSILSNTMLILLKLGAGLLIGSISVIAEAIHSGLDLVAAVIAFLSLRIAVQPADREHPFGHGKMEDVSAAAEAGLILFAAAIIVWEAAHRILEGAELVGEPDLGVGVMAVSVVANTLVSRHLFRVARRTDSLALEADARHLSTDVITSLGVMVGLAMVKATGWKILDPLAAMGVAALICRAAFDLIQRSFGQLVDERLPEAEEKIILDSIVEHYGEFVGFHELRTRKAGSERYIDLHLLFAPRVSLEQAHALTVHLEEDIAQKLPQSKVTIHIEPCDAECQKCPFTCRFSQGEAERPV